MPFLPEKLLEGFRSRAATVDATNAFPEDDYRELREAGYLGAFVPKEYGGAGLTLPEICAEQTRLARFAPATALGINMHHIIVGLGRYLVSQGVSNGELILREAAAGKLFAFGISEPGNDLVLFGSLSIATPDGNGGFTISGTKVFTSLAPAWDYLMTFGAWKNDDGVRNVFGVLKREDGGFEVKPDWDTLGMRATQSNTTVLQDAKIPADAVLGIVQPGANVEPVVYGIFSHFEILLGATYQGIGERAIEVACEHVKNRRSVMNNDVYAHDPAIRWRLAEAALHMYPVGPALRELANKVENATVGVPGEVASLADYPKLSAAKNLAAESSLRAVEESIRSCGGSSYYTKHELSRLYRDVLAGLFQPSDQESLHSAWATALLGPLPQK